MIQLIITLIGLVLGVAAFIALLEVIPAIGKNIPIAIFVFIVLFGAGITVAYIAWWLAVVVGIIALIIYIIKKKKPLEINDSDLEDSSSENNEGDNSSKSEDNNEL